MAFVNTMDKYGDEATLAMIIERTIDEYCDNSVTKIGAYAFYGCTALAKADVPNATEVGDYAFQKCTALVSADVPEATHIGTYAFEGCTALESYDFTNVTTIKNQAFNNCASLTEICCPLVNSVLWYTFQKCTSLAKADFSVLPKLGAEVFVDDPLTTLILRSSTLCELGNTNVFLRTPIASGTGYVYVPSALVDSYKAATNWSTYAAQIRAIEDYPDICGG